MKKHLSRGIVCFLLLMILALTVLPVPAEETAVTDSGVSEDVTEQPAALSEITEAAPSAESPEPAPEETEEETAETSQSLQAGSYVNTFWSLVPPIIAIILALLTKEVYSSLFFGVVAGSLLYTNFNLENTMKRVFR